MISINFMLRQVLRMMGLPYENIPISKTKKTLKSYQQYWDRIILLIGERIELIIYGEFYQLKKNIYIDYIYEKTEL